MENAQAQLEELLDLSNFVENTADEEERKISPRVSIIESNED